MKCLIHTIATILLLASCCTNPANGNGMETSSIVDSVGSDYTANATAIEQKKQEMLAVADSVGNFWFSTIPSGISTPQIVRLPALYSLHAWPER